MESANCTSFKGSFPDCFENLPCCFYVVQSQEPFPLLYANRETLRLFDCRDLEELRRHINNDGLNILAPEDRERGFQEIMRELAEKNGRFSHIQGHLFTRKNRIRYADVSGRTVNTETWGQVFFCTLQEIDIPTGQPVDRDIRDYVTEHLEEALENHWIQVYYQPVIRTLTGELCGLEALARWVDPQVGFLSPASFIPVLEQARLIHRLDAYVLEEVCRMLRERLDKNLCITPVSFNLSRYDFDSMDVFSVVENTRKKYSLPRDFLHVEITESTLAQNAQLVHQALDQLREKGYEIWLDDFGSGYSSLNVLKDYQVDLIKLDMGFLRNFTAKSRSIIASVITMAKDLGVKTLVEGVETKEQADFLAAMGCGRMQGYFFGKPQPLAGVLAHLEAAGRTVEPRKWFRFYDMASMVIRQTDRSTALFDMDEKGTLRFLFWNKVYEEEAEKLGYTIQDIETNMNQPEKKESIRTLRTFIQVARKKHSAKTFFYVDKGDYIAVRVQVVCEMNQHLLVQVEFQNISQNSSSSRQTKLDANLRYLYGLFEEVFLVDLDGDSMEQMYANNSNESPFSKKVQGMRAVLRTFTREQVYEEDQSGYLAYLDQDTVVQRIRKSSTGYISHFFRAKDSQGNYTWRETMATLFYKGPHPMLLTTARTIDSPVTVAAVSPGDKNTLPALLWDSFRKNTHSNYFWKDKERRFLGASKAFLRHYGFASEQEIIGKTDEDMNWHLDNEPYRQDELDVLHKGKVVENIPGECIVKGALHHIACYKWPIYRDGQIVGLMGTFFDADQVYHELRKTLPSPFEDPVSGLQNRQGFLNDMMETQEQMEASGDSFCLILLESRFDEYLKKSYEAPLLRKLIHEEGRIIREEAGTNSSISRLFNSMFAILRREKDPKESEALARKIQARLQDIHQVEGNPVTVTFRWSIVHSAEPRLGTDPKRKIRKFYRLAIKRLREQ